MLLYSVELWRRLTNEHATIDQLDKRYQQPGRLKWQHLGDTKINNVTVDFWSVNQCLEASIVSIVGRSFTGDHHWGWSSLAASKQVVSWGTHGMVDSNWFLLHMLQPLYGTMVLFIWLMFDLKHFWSNPRQKLAFRHWIYSPFVRPQRSSKIFGVTSLFFGASQDMLASRSASHFHRRVRRKRVAKRPARPATLRAMLTAAQRSKAPRHDLWLRALRRWEGARQGMDHLWNTPAVAGWKSINPSCLGNAMQR